VSLFCIARNHIITIWSYSIPLGEYQSSEFTCRPATKDEIKKYKEQLEQIALGMAREEG
jgi:hypothetical protein